MITIRDIILDALRLLQVITYDEELIETSMEKQAIRALQMISDNWSAQALLQYKSIEDTFDLIDGKYEYTIGNGADFNTNLPYKISYAYLKNSNTDYNLTPYSEGDYLAISDKTLTGMPTVFYYKFNYPIATLYLWCAPDRSNYQIVLLSYKALLPAPITNIDVTLNLDPIFNAAFIYNLATYLAPHYGITPDPAIIAVGNSSLEAIAKRSDINKVPYAKYDGMLLNNRGIYE